MKQLSLKVLCLTLLTTTSFAIAQESTQIHLSEVELQEIFSNPKRSYVYLGREASNIADVIEEISKLEDNQNSAVWGLRNHIEKGFVIGNYDAVAQALEQAEITFKKHAHRLDAHRAHALSQSLNSIINQVIEDKLTLDAEALEADPARSHDDILVIDQKLNVHGRAKFYKDVFFKDKATFDHFVKFEGKVKFKENVNIEGSLTVADEVVGCDLTVGCNISMVDSTDAGHGNIIKAGVPFIHNYPGAAGNNTFVGDNAGNFTMTGTQNSGFGAFTLNNDTEGSFNTAAGFGALFNNTVGANNTAVGTNALLNNTTGFQNSALGTGALAANTTGENNTALGYQTLFNNTVGMQNTAVGPNALAANTIGSFNTAVGFESLAANTVGASNTAVGVNALAANTTGFQNSALGLGALVNNTTGVNNTALGYQALFNNTIGMQNTAVGPNALAANTVGEFNTAVGFESLLAVTSGSNNIAIGAAAGNALTTGSNNIYIGLNAVAAGESNVTRIANIRGVTTGVADAIAVFIDSTGQLGTVSSSKAVKHEIQSMNDVSASIYNLNPVTFVYNSDTSETTQYGLIAEEVADVFPGIVVRNASGQPETVQYHVLPVLLLNEVKKLAARLAVIEAHVLN